MTSEVPPEAPVTGTRWALPAPIGALSRGLGLGGSTVRHVSGGIVGGIGGVMALWHASVLHASLGAPAIALLGTTVLLVLSISLVGLAGWMVLCGVDPVISTRIADWLILTGQYDGRSRQYHSRMRIERDRFVSLFDNLPNPGVHYVWRGGRTGRAGRQRCVR